MEWYYIAGGLFYILMGLGCAPLVDTWETDSPIVNILWIGFFPFFLVVNSLSKIFTGKWVNFK